MPYLQDLTAADFQQALAGLLPKGRVWRIIDSAGGLARTLLGMGAELARANNRLLDVIEEADPRTADELIGGWLRVLALPREGDTSPPTTLSEKRSAAWGALVARGGTQPPLLYSAIVAAGYDACEVEIGTLFRADESASDERVYDDSWASVWFVWRATTPAAGWASLQLLLDTIKPAHSIAVTIDGLHANEVTTPT